LGAFLISKEDYIDDTMFGYEVFNFTLTISEYRLIT